jgi:hypothetical protein
MDNNDRFLKGLIVLLVLALIWLCTSCSCDFHARKIKKKCGTITDTLVLRDTVITKELHTDTLFKHSVRRDTIVLKQDKLLVKYFYNSHDSTVYIQGKCLTDTIIKVIKVPYEKTVITLDYFPSWVKWLGIILVIAIIVLALLKKVL